MSSLSLLSVCEVVEAIVVCAPAPRGGQDFGSLSLLSLIQFYVYVVVGSLMRGGGGGFGSLYLLSIVLCIYCHRFSIYAVVVCAVVVEALVL